MSWTALITGRSKTKICLITFKYLRLTTAVSLLILSMFRLPLSLMTHRRRLRRSRRIARLKRPRPCLPLMTMMALELTCTLPYNHRRAGSDTTELCFLFLCFCFIYLELSASASESELFSSCSLSVFVMSG